MKQLEDLYTKLDGMTGQQSAQTLDQSYYSMLQVDDLRKRDEDQVVYKWFKRALRERESNKTGPPTDNSEAQSTVAC